MVGDSTKEHPSVMGEKGKMIVQAGKLSTWVATTASATKCSRESGG